MIRAAFLKYAGQCRIGRMDGAFVTYHNTQVCVCLCVPLCLDAYVHARRLGH